MGNRFREMASNKEQPAHPIAPHVVDSERRRGRGARSNKTGRFEAEAHEAFDDGWESLGELEAFKTEVIEEAAKSIISHNDSPDVSFESSINPYRGCEHGCIYCYARPSHCYLGHSAGLDFETKLYAKPNAAALLEREFKKPGYKPETIALGGNTDPYQPIERERRITRSILEVMAETNHPVGIITKSALVARDIDGREKSGKGRRLDHHARSSRRPRDGATRRRHRRSVLKRYGDCPKPGYPSP